MSKSKNNLNSLNRALVTPKANPSVNIAAKLTAGPNPYVLSQGINARSTANIQFGKASSSRTSSSASSDLTNLLKSAEKSAASSLLGGGGIFGGLSIIGSFGSLFSGLFGGRGGSKSLPALPAFSLPQSETVSYSVNSTRSVAQPSTTPVSGQSNASIYRSSPALPPSSNASPAQIVQAVKTALLQSSSLNDVISEL